MLHCIVFRFQSALDRFIENQGLKGDVDRISMAGGTKEWEKAFYQLEISLRLHEIKKIYLINHQDCGAYGPDVAADKENEWNTHKWDLLKAKVALEEKYPEVEVFVYFLTLDKEFKLMD